MEEVEYEEEGMYDDYRTWITTNGEIFIKKKSCVCLGLNVAVIVPLLLLLLLIFCICM
jgi:hypothetical protein